MEKHLRVVLLVLHLCQLLITGSAQAKVVIQPSYPVYKVPTGVQLQLNCSFSEQGSSLTDKSLKWYKDEIGQSSDETKGLTISSVSSPEQSLLSTSLTYRAVVNNKMSGRYTCKLEEGSPPSSTVESHIEVQVIPVQKADAELQDGVEAVLECRIVEAGITAVWKRNNITVENLNVDGNRRYLIHPNGNLQIKNPTLDDLGEYHCTFVLPGREQPWEIPVTLYAQLRIEAPESPQVLLLHDTSELTCRVTGYPLGSVTWYKDGNKIERHEGSRYNLSEERGTTNFTLRISSVSFDDAGNYTCVASTSKDPATNFSKTISVVVQDTMDDNFVFKKDALLRCRPGSPGVNVTWYKNGTRVLDPELQLEIDTLFAEQENGDLQLKHPTRKAAGVYECRYLTENNTLVQKNVTLWATPYVLPFQANYSLTEQDRLEIVCQVLGYPPPSITWRKGDVEIDAHKDGRYKLSEAKGFANALLVIESVEVDDEGKYQCQAASTFYPNSTSTKFVLLHVRGKLAPLWPLLGILAQVVVLALIIFVSEKRRKRMEMTEDKPSSDSVNSDPPLTSSSVRHRVSRSKPTQGESSDAVTKL